MSTATKPNFRKRKELKTQAEALIAAIAQEQIERRLQNENHSITLSFELPNNLLEKIECFTEVELVAELMRMHWNLGICPIIDLTATLESHGIRVFAVDTDEEHFDGFSNQVNGKPLIVISSNWPGDRQRFTLAYELGHLILHNRHVPGLSEELVYNRFAGAFLFPKEAVHQAFGDIRKTIEWKELFHIKEQFAVSMGTISHRLLDLKIITEGYYKQIVRHFRQNNWHLYEPGTQIPPEKVRTFYN